MASSKPAWSTHLVVKLVRGLPGTIKKNRTAVRRLGLPKRDHSAVVQNTPTILGVIKSVKRLLAVETLEMYLERVQKEVQANALRPPLVFTHAPAKKAEQPKTG